MFSRHRLALVAVVAICALGLCVAAFAHRQAASPTEIRAQADKLYDERSYALSLDKYRVWLSAAPPNAAGRTEVEYRIATALGKSDKWDDAFAAFGAYLVAHRSETLWTARALYGRGLLTIRAPHVAYKVGDRIYRGQNYPHTSSSEVPVAQNLVREDGDAATADLEGAFAAYDKLPAADRTTFQSEIADLTFDLIDFLQHTRGWGSDDDWTKAKATDWRIVPSARYDATWPTPKKILTLYAKLIALKPGTDDIRALAGMKRALYVDMARPTWVRRLPPDWLKAEALPYVYTLDPLKLITATADAYPNHPQAPQMRLIAANYMSQRGQLVEAFHGYNRILTRYPGNKWSDDARSALNELTKKSINLSSYGPRPTGQNAGIQLSLHNVKKITLTAYRINLSDALLAETPLNNYDAHFTSFTENFGNIAKVRGSGTKAATWKIVTDDPGDFKPFSQTITTPLTERGAYLVDASGDDDKVRAATIVLITDLSIVRKIDKDEILCYVADSASGAPVRGASVVVKEGYYQNNQKKVEITRGVTDGDGTFRAPRVRRDDTNESQTEGLAFVPGSDRYAVIDNQGWYGGNNGSNQNRDEVKAYSTTDRPVYRPGQKVYYRELIAQRTAGGDWHPLVGNPVVIRIDGPKGEVTSTQTVTSTPFGSINGSFDLPRGAALGEYSINLDVSKVPIPDGTTNQMWDVESQGANQFRVEEYRKPEFLVRVKTNASQLRFGDTAHATVQATYYWGAPVPNAAVTYTVFRSPFYPQYRFPRPYDWWTQSNYGEGAYAYRDRSSEELVSRGTATTDANGNTEISFKAERGGRRYDGDFAYYIDAEVTDRSRRVINGEGVLKVTRQGFYAYLDVKRGFYNVGETAQIEVRTQDASENPVATPGRLTVYRNYFDADHKPQRQAVFTQDLATDTDGKAFTTWRADTSGELTAEFAARDKFGDEVVGAQPLWIAGSDLSDSHVAFQVGGMSLITDKTTYAEGEIAHVLIVADEPDDYVLVTTETGNQIIEKRLIRVQGRAATFDVPIVRAHVPNFALAAVAVRDYRFYSWNQELFVPPVRQFANVRVTSAKAEYRPGETGTFMIDAAGPDGKPVAAELSLGVIDSSVFYIQKSYAPDIRRFYYGDRRSINVDARSSQDYSQPAAAESDFPEPTLSPHGFVPPETGRIILSDRNAEYRQFCFQFGYQFGADRYEYWWQPGFQMGGNQHNGYASLHLTEGGTGSISGVVLDVQGRPSKSAVVRLTRENGTLVGTRTTDGDGNYSFPAVDPGAYVVGIRTPSVTLDLNMAVELTAEHPAAVVNFHQAPIPTPPTDAAKDMPPGNAYSFRSIVVGGDIPISGSLNGFGGGGFGRGRNMGGFDGSLGMLEAEQASDRLSYDQGIQTVNRPKAPAAPAKVRSNFADTAFWTPAVVTDPLTGKATVTVTFPDSLTTWKATASGLTPTMQVGSGETEAVTKKRLLVRLESPRFFVERDRVTLSAIVENDLTTPKSVHVALSVGDDSPLQFDAKPETTVTVSAGGEKRVDFTAHVSGSGTASIKSLAETDEESDATQLSFPVLEYGVQKFLAQSGMLADGQSNAAIPVDLPKARKANSAVLLVQLNPSLAATMLDALPYLADYPYGCVEQTMSRFLPSVLVANALQSSGVDLPALQKRAAILRDREAAGPASTTFGQSQPVDGGTDQTAYTYPTGTPSVLKTPELASHLSHGDRWQGPVFDADRLKSMTDEGLSKLASMQHADGGWGWWIDDRSDPYMTAYVVQGLAMAVSAKVGVDTGVLSRGCAYLAADIVKRDDERDIAVWEAYALSFKHAEFPASANTIVTGIYAKRDRLSAYGQALLALTLNQIGRKAEAQTVCRNLRNSALIDRENGTANWPSHHYGGWWCWWNNDTETTAWALRAFSAIEPDGDLAPMLANWIVRHKRGNAWNSTKETAMAVYALTEYARSAHEFAPNYTVTVALGDKIARKYTINAENALFFDNQFLVPPALLADGKQTVQITKAGKGRLYWTAAVQYVTTEDKIASSGGELKVERRYYRLTPKVVKRKDWSNDTFNALDYSRQMLTDGASLRSGDLIEVEMIVDAKNDYDYVVLEDGKPAGCEPVELRSGCRFTDGLFATEELRDTKTAFFVSHLPQGTRVLRYRLRAEAPGLFHALPTNAYACYAPDVRALSNSWSVDVRDAGPAVAGHGGGLTRAGTPALASP